MTAEKTAVYTVHLAPMGESLATATDTRTASIEIPRGLKPVQRYKSIRERVLDRGVVDAHALRNHWTIATYIRENAAQHNRLRDALFCCTPPVDSETDERDFARIVLPLRDDQTQSSYVAELTVWEPRKRNYTHWRSHTDAFQSHPILRVNEALLRTVADVQPTPVAMFTTDPLEAQREFLKRVTENRDAITARLDSLANG